MSLASKHISQLQSRIDQNSLRKLKTVHNLIDFSSNDYLGFAGDESLLKKIQSSAAFNHLGSTGSRLLTGNSTKAQETENLLKEWLSAESCLVMNSGYMANLAVLSSVPQRGDTILYDELSHASIKDGMRLSMADKFSFTHNNMIDLEKKLRKAGGDKYVVTESIFSMDGDEAPLGQLIEICDQFDARLIVDEAHATGIYGRHGGGLSQQNDLEKSIFCRIYTFGKAMGYHGACVAGSHQLIEYLINFARPFIYTTALPDHNYDCITQVFTYLSENRQRLNSLNLLIDHYLNEFERELSDKYQRTKSNHPIQTIIIAGNDMVKCASQKLKDDGFDVRPILSPTVKQGQERLRICLHSFNSKEEVSQMVASLVAI